MTADRDGDAGSSWEQRLRALDAELATYGAEVEGDRARAVAAGGSTEQSGGSTERAGEVAARNDEVAVAVADATPAGGGVRAEPDPDPDGSRTNGEEADSEEQAAARRRKALFDWVVVIGVALLVAFLVRTFVLAHFVVDGVSMTSTLHDDDRVFVNKLSYRLHDPNRGDVVVLHQLNGASERDLIKRVIGLPGEEVRFEECVVFIDGVALQEPYLDPAATTPGTCGGNMTPVVVPDDHVFVMGDNRGGSMDSRDLGPIDDGDLVGRAFVVFWPQSHWQWL